MLAPHEKGSYLSMDFTKTVKRSPRMLQAHIKSTVLDERAVLASEEPLLIAKSYTYTHSENGAVTKYARIRRDDGLGGNRRV